MKNLLQSRIWSSQIQLDELNPHYWLIMTQKVSTDRHCIRLVHKFARISYRKLIVINIRKAVFLVSYIFSIYSYNIFPSFNQFENLVFKKN